MKLKPSQYGKPMNDANETVEDHIAASTCSSNKIQTKSNVGSDGYESVEYQSKTSSVREDDVFKMDTRELKEEPGHAKWRASDSDTDPTSNMQDEKRQSHSSYSQTTV